MRISDWSSDVCSSDLSDWLTRELAGWWQSPVQRAGWKRVRLEALTSLRRECRARGFDVPRSAFTISRRRVEDLRFHSAVDTLKNDAKRHADATPRIRRHTPKPLPIAPIFSAGKPHHSILLL